jgi:hypothetical protein
MFARLTLLAAVLAASPALATPWEDVQQEIADVKLCVEWASLAQITERGGDDQHPIYRDVLMAECLHRVHSTITEESK